MSKNSKKVTISKSAIAAAIVIMGGVGVYAGVALNNASVTNTVANNATPTSSPSSSGATNLALTSPSIQTAQQATLSNTHALQDLLMASHNEHDATPIATVAISAEMMARMELPADFIPVSAKGSQANAPFANIQLREFTAGQKAITALGDQLEAVAQWYGMNSEGLRQLLLTDNTVHLDRKGRILHIDAGVAVSTLAAGPRLSTTNTVGKGTTSGGTSATSGTTAVAAPYALDKTFTLHSKPNSTRVLYLNFTGNVTNPAFSLDAVPSTFNNTERTLIQNAWARVVEDYAAFDVDITTEAPLSTVGKIGATIMITPQTSSAGGWAYLYSFSNNALTNPPAYCFPNNLANSEKPIGECISHELGHTLGLLHQGTTKGVEYFGGAGSGETGWAPIMGVGYYKNLTQWAKGEYTNANNKQDAYVVMSSTGLQKRPDDHGNSIASADNLISLINNGLNNLSATGVIEDANDVDVFKFSAGAGTATFTVTGATLGSNLDIAVDIINDKGIVIASANPAATLAATITVILPTDGTYFLSVRGAGKGNPLIDGYTNYGSLGVYNITGSSALAVKITPPPPPLPPQPLPRTLQPLPVSLQPLPVTATPVTK